MMTAGSMATNMGKMKGSLMGSGPGLKPVVAGGPAAGEYPAAKSGETYDVLLIAFENDTNNYHFLPHVVYVEPGATIKWHHTAKGISERRTHTTTAITPNTMPGYPRLIPTDASAWDSGMLPGVGPFEYERVSGKGEVNKGPFSHTFEKQGVYVYLCQNHFGFGMAAAVVVGDLWKENRGDGWEPAMTNPISPSRIPEEDPGWAKTISMKINKAIRPFIWNGKKSKKTPESPPWMR